MNDARFTARNGGCFGCGYLYHETDGDYGEIDCGYTYERPGQAFYSNLITFPFTKKKMKCYRLDFFLSEFVDNGIDSDGNLIDSEIKKWMI